MIQMLVAMGALIVLGVIGGMIGDRIGRDRLDFSEQIARADLRAGFQRNPQQGARNRRGNGVEVVDPGFAEIIGGHGQFPARDLPRINLKRGLAQQEPRRKRERDDNRHADKPLSGKGFAIHAHSRVLSALTRSSRSALRRISQAVAAAASATTNTPRASVAALTAAGIRNRSDEKLAAI